MNIYSYTKNDALLAYIDLLGTSLLYEENIEPLQKQAERLYMSLVAIFETEFQNSFDNEEIRDNFYINIYADSIMIHPKTNENDTVVKLIEFLLRFQWELIFGGIPASGPVPCIALVDRQPYFFIRFESPEEGSILQSKFTTCSLCGGKGMIEMNKRAKGLSVGVYVSKNVKDKLSDTLRERSVPVKKDDLYFIKQDDRDIEFLFLPHVQSGISSHIKGSTLEEILKNVFLSGITKYDESKWRQWIDIHEGKAFEIKRINRISPVNR